MTTKRTVKALVMRKFGTVDEAHYAAAHVAPEEASEISIERVVDLTDEQFAGLAISLLRPRDIFRGVHGWTEFKDTAGNSIIIDAQGFNYARYVAVEVL